MKLARVEAFPLSCPIPEAHQVRLGIGRTVKRDAVLVKITGDEGCVGWGEAHAGRAPTVIAELINSTLAPLLLGAKLSEHESLWQKLYRLQLASHGTGAAAALAISGIDMALWDLRGKLVGQPLCALLGAAPRAIPAYAGGISFGYGETGALVDEAQAAVALGYRALKLRFGLAVAEDLGRAAAVRAAVGEGIDLLADANCSYTLPDAQRARSGLDGLAAGWLEEPFPAHDFRSYRALAPHGHTPLAAGENHYLLSDFDRRADDGAVRLWQPDLSKCGGITEALRIAALAQAHGVSVHPHTSVTGLNVAASLHFLSALPNAGYFEADFARYNPLRTALCSPVAEVSLDGTFMPPAGPGLGIEIDEAALRHFPAVRGAGYL